MPESDILNSARLSLVDVAKRLDLNISTVWRWCLKGCKGRRLPSILIGGRRHILLQDLETFLAEGRDQVSGAAERDFESRARMDDRSLSQLL